MLPALDWLRRSCTDDALGRAAWLACLGLPLALLHARAVAEILIVAIDLLFLLHVFRTRDLAWTRHAFTRAAAVWWLWLVLCSVIGTGGLLMAVLAVRLPLLGIAAGHWLLPPASRQRWLWLVLATGFAWIALQTWQQALTGHNLFGQGRWTDGALTGPFNKPRAGPAFILLFFVVMVPAGMALANGPARRAVSGLALLAVSVLTMLLIGQRMPSLLMLLGLGVAAMLLPRLRLPVVAAIAAGALLLAAMPVISPVTNDKLVRIFAWQMRHFAESDYGLIFARAVGVAELHPWVGLGFDGFRRECAVVLNMRGPDQLLDWVRACNLHPHNYYLEAADDAGLPGVATLAAMAAAALLALGRGLWRQPDPLRVGLFATVLVALWPIASTSAFTSMPNSGWLFLLLGFGLAAIPTVREPGTQPTATRL